MARPIEIEKVERSARMAAELLKSLANEKRLKLLCKLYEGEKSVTELLGFVDITQSALSQHLAYLRRKQIVKTRRKGTKILYSLADQPAQDLMRVLCQIFRQ